MNNITTIILIVIQIIAFTFFIWTTGLTLKDYYHNKKLFKRHEAKQKELNSKIEKNIMLQIRSAYGAGVRDGWRQHESDGVFKGSWNENEPEIKEHVHKIVNIMAGTED